MEQVAIGHIKRRRCFVFKYIAKQMDKPVLECDE